MADRKTKGAISGDAQMILDALDDLHLPESFKNFVRKIRQSTYYKAGFHVDDGIDGIEEHSCYFSLAAWAKDLGMSRQQLYNLRADLIEHSVITYTPVPDDPHYGIMAWNLSVAEWIPFKKGGARPGAGRPKKIQSVYDSVNQSVYKNYSNGVQSEINRCTANGNETSEPQGLSAPLRNSTKKHQETGSDANASGDAADADAPMPAPSAPIWGDETETAGETKGNTPLQGRSSKGRSSAAPAEGRARASPPGKGKGMTRTDKDPDGESSFRRMCFRLMGERYERFNRERLAGTARRLFNQGYTEEQVEGCWRETIRDPRYSPLNPLTFDILAQGATNKIDGFIQDPDEYRRKIQDEIEKHEYIEGRKKANGKSGKRDRSPATEHHASTRADVF